jgi:hypothetical protein
MEPASPAGLVNLIQFTPLEVVVGLETEPFDGEKAGAEYGGAEFAGSPSAAVVTDVVEPTLRAGGTSRIEAPVPLRLVWIWTTCSCWMSDELAIIDNEPLWKLLLATVPAMLMVPTPSEVCPKKNGWHGAANGCVVELTHPWGDQKRLCVFTVFAALEGIDLLVQLTMTVTRNGFFCGLLLVT